jgi:Tfp pilus assembly protein PilW
MVEVIVGSVISVIVLSSAVTLFISVVGAWARGETMMEGENDTREVVRVMSMELREAMWLSIDTDGMGVTYRKPRKTASGDFEIPTVWDGVDRRMFLDGSTLKIRDASNTRILAKGVMATDPFRTVAHAMQAKKTTDTMPVAPLYRIFEAPNVGIVSEVTITLVTSGRGANGGETVRAKKRETITLRNIPELIK